MNNFKFNLGFCAALLFGSTAAGCVVETADEEAALLDPVAGVEEEVGEAEQALDMCTPPGSGGGTWGPILKLCMTPDKYLYVMKHDGSAFTSSGTLELKIWIGTIMTTNVFPGQTKIYFGQHLSNAYMAVFTSSQGGTAYTGELVVP